MNSSVSFTTKEGFWWCRRWCFFKFFHFSRGVWAIPGWGAVGPLRVSL